MAKRILFWIVASTLLLGSSAAVAGSANAARADNLPVVASVAPGKGSGKSASAAPQVAADALFADITSALPDLPAVYEGNANWVDVDGDGRLDLFVDGRTGPQTMTKLYLNTSTPGKPSFVNVDPGSTSLPSLTNGAAAWADFDNDGKVDLFLDGSTTSNGGGLAALYRNTSTIGAPSFVSVSVALPDLAAMKMGTATWADIDSDGKLDLLVEGDLDSQQRYVKLWRNLSTPDYPRFVDATAALGDAPALGWSSMAWGDYDGDGRADLYLQGFDNPSPYKPAARPTGPYGQGLQPTDSVPLTRLYRNTSVPGMANLTDVTAAVGPFVTLFGGAAAWGDADNDGKLDLFVDGSTGTAGLAIKLYHNESTADRAAFSDIPAGLDGAGGIYYGPAVWGDYDGDGRSDLLVTGSLGLCCVTRLFHNISTPGSPAFEEANSAIPALPLLERAALAWGDFDNDGKLDVFLDGVISYDLPNSTSKLYHNSGTATNTPPAAPGGLFALENGTHGVTLRWSAATDAQTPAAGLSYNLRVGTTPGGNDVFSSMADASGWRRIPARGPIQGTSYTLVSPPPGMLYWSVQAIDSGFAGGAFAAEQSFLLSGPTFTPQPTATRTPLGTPTALPFTDVPVAAYFYAPAQYLALHGIISGYNTAPPCPAGQSPCFLPFNATTRAQVVKIVVLAVGLPIFAPHTTFRDVPANDVFHPYVETAYNHQIVSGYSCGGGCLEFRPSTPVTRAQLAKIVTLAASWTLLTPDQAHFADVPREDPFYSFVETALSHGVIGGYADNTFRPGANATRGQVAKIVHLAVTQH